MRNKRRKKIDDYVALMLIYKQQHTAKEKGTLSALPKKVFLCQAILFFHAPVFLIPGKEGCHFHSAQKMVSLS